MRPQFYAVAQHLKLGREHAVIGQHESALLEFDRAVKVLRHLPPERTRDVLLAHALLNRYQTMTPKGDKPNQEALENLRLGVSYARSTRDPLARAVAEQCLEGLEGVV